VSEDESSSESCLHCEINELVREHIEGKQIVNLPKLVAKMSESLVELILLGPEEQWGNLLAQAIRDIGEVFLEKSGAVQSNTTHRRWVGALAAGIEAAMAETLGWHRLRRGWRFRVGEPGAESGRPRTLFVLSNLLGGGRSRYCSMVFHHVFEKTSKSDEVIIRKPRQRPPLAGNAELLHHFLNAERPQALFRGDVRSVSREWLRGKAGDETGGLQMVPWRETRDGNYLRLDGARFQQFQVLGNQGEPSGNWELLFHVIWSLFGTM
jgi:hypothetical protein